MKKNDFEQPIPSAAVPSQGLTLGEFHDDTANAVPLQSLHSIVAPKPSNGPAPRTTEDAMADLQARKVCLSNRPPLPTECISVEVEGYSYKFGTFGSFSILKGKQKAGKSMVAIAIVAAAISGRPIGPFSVQLPLGRRRILYFDTEQGAAYAALALEKIARLAGLPTDQVIDNLEYFDLRADANEKRLQLVDEAFQIYTDASLIIVDGIADLTPDTNELKEAQRLGEHLLRWTDKTNSHLVGIIHENKNSANSRGHAGGESERKTENQTSVCKSMETGEWVYTVDNNDMRGGPQIPKFAFRLVDGLPVFDVDPPNEVKPGRKKSFSPSDLTPVDYRKILSNIIAITANPRFKELISGIKAELEKLGINVGDAKANEVLLRMKTLGLVQSPPPGTAGYSFNLSQNENAPANPT